MFDPENPHWLDIDFDRDIVKIVGALAIFIYLISYLNVNYPTNTDYFESAAIQIPGEYQKSESFSVLMMGQ